MTHVNKVYQFSSRWLTPQEYLDILNNVDLTRTQSWPPAKPQPGELFVVLNDKNVEDWKSDQYRWTDKGIKHIPRHSPTLTVRYYECFDGSPFHRRAYFLYQKGKKHSALTLVHYTGCTEGITITAHGNRRHNLDKQHIMTAKSVIKEQKQLLSGFPQEIYKKQISKEVPPILAPTLQPRDRKQVTNTIFFEKQRRLLSNDDIVGVYLLHKELPDFVQKIVLAKDFYVILCETESLNQFAKVSSYQDCLLGYDTTFNLGDFYVSPLSYRHPLLQGDPVIPLAYLIHDRKDTRVHAAFFNFICTLCPQTNGVPIVTDREQAINVAIKNELPKSKNFYCWNHIQQDIRFWLRKQKNTSCTDEQVYVSNVWDMLDSDSREDCVRKYTEMSNTWSSKFKKYFDSNIFEAIIATGKWVLEQYNKYIPRSGITNNAAEALNSVLKRCLQRKEVNLQVLTLTLHHLDLFYRKEILRGFCNLGNYKLKECHKSLEMAVTNVCFPASHLPLDNLPYIFWNDNFHVRSCTDLETPYTNFSVAKALILNGCVKLIPEDKIFVISSLNSEEKYVVTLFPERKCSCKAKKNCHHITAAQMSIGVEQQKHAFAKLSTIMRKERGYKAGRKRGPKKVTVVEAADDSLVDTTDPAKVSLLIPTVSHKNGTVKLRYSVTKEDSLEHSSLKDFSNVISSTPKKPKITGATNLVTKQRLICGRGIYLEHIKSLTRPEFIFDSILDTFIPILIMEEKDNLNSVSIFSTDSIIMNYVTPGFYKDALGQFLKFRIPEYDIVLIPITYNGHCFLYVILKRQKMIIFLDSLHCPVTDLHLTLIKKLYRHYEIINNLEPTELKLFVPKDIPKQKNGIDCGLYVCLYAEMLIKQDFSLIQHTHMPDMSHYRILVQQKLMHYFYHDTTEGAPREYSHIDVSQIRDDNKMVYPHEVDQQESIEGNTMMFLSTIIKNYWAENTSVCHLDTSLCERGPEVLCQKCYHWLHLKCEKPADKDLIDKYICKACKSNND